MTPLACHRRIDWTLHNDTHFWIILLLLYCSDHNTHGAQKCEVINITTHNFCLQKPVMIFLKSNRLCDQRKLVIFIEIVIIREHNDALKLSCLNVSISLNEHCILKWRRGFDFSKYSHNLNWIDYWKIIASRGKKNDLAKFIWKWIWIS